jgi:hypothetical protein
MSECFRCKQRGKTWNGGDPKCAFVTGVFDPGNWMCATMNALRDAVGENYVWNDDQKAAVLAADEGTFIALSWYKDRGRTEGAWLIDEGKCYPLGLSDAEKYLRDLKFKEWTSPPADK